MHKVHTPFINPFIFNRLRGKEPFIAGTAIDERTIEVCGDRYGLDDKETVILNPGEQVYLCIHNGFFHIETAEEHSQRVLQKLAEKWGKRKESER